MLPLGKEITYLEASLDFFPKALLTFKQSAYYISRCLEKTHLESVLYFGEDIATH